LLAVVLGMNFTATAQDSRGRVTSTIIADGLAQLPAQNLDVLEQVMSEIAGTGAEGVQQLAAMLGPSAEGKNAPFQYAIDGLTSYVTQKGREAACAEVKKGLEAAIAKCTDEGNKVFLQDQLNKLTPGSVEVKHAVEDLSTVAPASRAVAEFRDKVAATPAKKQTALLLKTLNGDNRQLRNTALELGTTLSAGSSTGTASSLGSSLATIPSAGGSLGTAPSSGAVAGGSSASKTPSFPALVCKAYPKLKPDAQADVLRWLGNRHDTDHVGTVLKAINSTDSQLATAAIEAAGKIGGTEALTALIAALDGSNSTAARAALTTFNGSINDGVLEALKTKGENVNPELISLAGERHITAAYEPLTALLSNGKLRDVAAQSLAAIVTEDKFSDLLTRFQPYPDRYFGLMAQRASKEDIVSLVNAANGANGAAARAAMLKVNNADIVSSLMSLAKDDATNRDAMLNRALALTKKAGWANLTKYQLYKQALDMKPSTATVNNYLSALSTLGNEPSLNLAAQYLDVKANDLAAAHAVADLVEKNEPMQRGAHVREMLLKAQNVFKSHTENADAGYAVDQINTILPKVIDDPNAATAKVTKLSEEEEKEGFELLFDGTSIDNWQGNKSDYVPIDGAIYVSAHYGSEGNLYTTKKYSDFVFRFEFCFVRPGINNGVGIRTSQGVDAAYEGMEIQILDHDDPIYKGLREYQVHGSVYGIIPAKRYKHKPLGEWNYEEIRAEGDHITVTLNGEVLVDGNIREACQGHNMAPEEGKPNPYTVDHQSHPGLFNKDGLICFCGHGEGLKLRNIRVLDLAAKKKGTKAKRKK